MIEFDSLCYLQNHKTGCTFVEAFLRKFCKEPIRHYAKHAAWQRRDEGKFYFVNVREPLDAYLSLFNYGLDRRGEIYARLSVNGFSSLYAAGIAGFPRWLDFVLDARHAALVYPAESMALAPMVGLQSLRFLRLASPGFEGAARRLTSRRSIEQYLEQYGTVDAVIRNEVLADDLSALVQGPLAKAIEPMRDALAWIRNAPRVNASNRRDGDAPLQLDAALRARLDQREWYLYEHFYEKEGLK